MSRRKRAVMQTAANYWPGYVDALTNVVLNLLFLIAMFGIALTVMNSTPRRAGPQGNGVAAETTSAARDSDAGGQSGPGGAAPAAVVLARDDRGAPRPGAPLGPLYDQSSRGAAQQAEITAPRGPAGVAPLAAAGPALRDQASRPGQAGERQALAGSEQGGDPARAAAAAAVPGGEALAPGARRAGPGALAGGYPFAGVPRGQLDFLVADAYQRRLMPGVRVVRQADAAGGVLVTVTLAVGTEPVAALRQAGFRTSLRVSLAGQVGPGESRLRVWTATRLTDPALRRAAYLALIEARNQLLALGYPPGAIELRLIEGSTVGRDGKQFYIHAAPATSN